MATLQKLTYRFTLDAFRNGIQRILQGWVTGENLSRKLEISLVSGHDTYELPLEGVTASMYVTTPTTHTLSINACEIDYESNKIIYDVLDSDISEAGLVNLQLKVFDNEKILISPSFQLEVWESTISDSQAVESETYTALTAALAQAEAYAEKAIVQAYIDEDYTFVIEFADGTDYTSSALKDCFEDCEAEALKAEGYAVGKQNGVDVTSGSPYYQNNAKFFSGMANGYANMAENAKGYAYDYANDALGYKNDASGYATTAGAKATLAESYAVGGTGTRTGEDDDNAKHYKEVCEQIAASLEGGFLPMGTITFESLPTENVESGWMYNISNDFVTDSRFKDGSGKAYPSGTNVYFTGDSMWDCLSAPYQTAGNTSYDNTESGLVSDDVQGAIDEVAEDVNDLGDKVETLEETRPETDKTVATREGATASKAYTIGEWIVDSEGYSGIVIASVAQGSAWTLNTNYARRNRSDSASAFIRLATVSDTTKTFNEVLNSFWNLISSVSSSRKMNLAIAESGSGGRRYISRVQIASNTEAYFQRMMLSMSNQGRIDIAQFYCHATNSKVATNNGGTYTDLSSNTISSTIELILFI